MLMKLAGVSSYRTLRITQFSLSQQVFVLQGNPADARMKSHALKRGVKLTSISRPIRPSDFEEFDLILAMDKSNLGMSLSELLQGLIVCFYISICVHREAGFGISFSSFVTLAADILLAYDNWNRRSALSPNAKTKVS